MKAIPLARFFNTNWLNSHHNQYTKLTRNNYETIMIGDSIAAGLAVIRMFGSNSCNP